ncbi:hypothetical protein SLA2020_246830 [Shorea laevis]
MPIYSINIVSEFYFLCVQLLARKGRRRSGFSLAIEVMDMKGSKFGEGPRELGGAVDLITQFKLWPLHEFLCKRLLPLSILETHYLHNVVGDTEIGKGEGMELAQLFQNDSFRGKNQHFNPFDLDLLMEAFRMQETASVDLLPSSV